MAPPPFTPPTKGWLAKYLGVLKDMQDECPAPFSYLCGAVVVGHLIGHNTGLPQRAGKMIYPHINCLLSSPAGQCRRSEGSKQAVHIAKLAGAHVFPGKVSGEALIDQLVAKGDVLLYVGEMSTVIGKREHQKAIVPLLTDLMLHGKEEFRDATRTGGEKVAKRVNLSMIATSAPDWFYTSMPEEAYGGGFMSRFIVCYLEDRDVFHISLQADGEAEVVWDGLAQELRALVDAFPKGQLAATDAAERWIVDWYGVDQKVKPADARLHAHHSRRPAQVSRLAMVVACCEGASELTVDHLEEALRVIKWCEGTVYAMYGYTDEMASYMSRGEQRVLSELAGAGGELTHQQLIRRVSKHFNGGTREVKDALLGLVEKGIVDKVSEAWSSNTMYPPKSWRLVKDKERV